jgi:phosphatidylinositol alpha-mannosyltransferase
MKIAFVLDDTLDKPDGVQQYVLALGEWLRGQDHEVHYLTGASSRTDIPNLHSLSRNMHVKFNGNHLSIPLPANRRRIRALMDREQFDVVHVQMPYSPFMAARVIAATGKRTAVFGTFHILPVSPLVRWATGLLGLWLRRSLKRFDRIVAVSPAAQTFAVHAFKLDACDVLPNVADVARFANTHTAQTTSDVPTIMFLGRLVPRKGCATLLEAASLLQQRSDKPFRLVIAGKGQLLHQLRLMAGQLKISDIVEFAGFVDEADKPQLIASADIMAFPSSGGESFGIVLIEAMAANHPLVLAGDNPGYRSVLGERPDLLFPPGDAEALAAKLAYYLEHETARREALAWQQNHVQQFDVPVVGNKLLTAYAQIVQDRLLNPRRS